MAAGTGGTREAGLAVMASTMSGWGVPMDGVVLADGSGLSNDNRATCNAFVDVLAAQRAHRSARRRPARRRRVGHAGGRVHRVGGDRAVAGQDRHARQRAVQRRSAGGEDAVGLPPRSRAAGPIEFSLLLNATGTLTDQSVYRPIWDAFVDVLATYPAGPTPAELGPR